MTNTKLKLRDIETHNVTNTKLMQDMGVMKAIGWQMLATAQQNIHNSNATRGIPRGIHWGLTMCAQS